MTDPQVAFIGLGSNLDDPHAQVCSACHDLKAHPHITITGQSHWYRSKAVGPGKQDDYINGAVRVETTLAPPELLDALQNIEEQHHRVRVEHWGPRTLDLDLLLYGEQQIQHPRLTVPHKELPNRNFVLQPLLDIDPDLRLPDGRLINDILHIIGLQDLTPLEHA